MKSTKMPTMSYGGKMPMMPKSEMRKMEVSKEMKHMMNMPSQSSKKK